MMCPRCGNEWDVSKTPCSRCGLLVRLPGHSGTTTRSQTPPSGQQGAVLPVKQPSSESTYPPSFKKTTSTASNSLPKLPEEGANIHNSVSAGLPPLPPLPPGQPVSSSNAELKSTSSDLSWSAGQPGQSASASNADRKSASGLSWPAGTSSSALEREQNALPNTQLNQGRKIQAQTDVSSAGYFPAKEMSRSNTQPPVNRSRDLGESESVRPHPPLRPSRLVTDSLKGGEKVKTALTERKEISFAPQPETPLPPGMASSQPGITFPSGVATSQLQNMPDQMVTGPLQQKERRVLVPGTLLRSGRYRLRELQERQEWTSGVYEATWIAQDAQRAGAQVTICELEIPDSGPMMVQSMLRAATMALTSVGRHPRIPTLWDAFSDQGQNFFVFEPIEGESLLARMHRTGRALPEQDVIECCLQMAEILDLLSQQNPPLAHGLIRPEHIIMSLSGSQYTLTNFSIILAGGATQFVTGLDRTQISPFMAPEFVRGVVDVRSDLYSLLATAYYAVTGSVPTGTGNGNMIPSAQRLNPNISADFDAILAKGLRPMPGQRYQRPSELRQDLLGIRSVNGTLSLASESPVSNNPSGQQMQSPPLPQTPSTPTAPDSVAQILPNLLATGIDDDIERSVLLPRPEDLPPLEPRNDTLHATIWLVGILACLILIVWLGHH